MGASATYTAVTSPGPVQRVTGIAIDPQDVNTAVVTYSGFCSCPLSNAKKHVFMSTNDGSSWSDISNLPDLPVYSVVIDPGTMPHSIIVANDAGVMRTLDSGSTWQRLGTNLPLVQSTALALDTSVNPAVLRVGTYGRSVFELTAGASADFTISASPPSVAVPQNSAGTTTITTSVSGGFNSAISLSASGLPSGVTASFNPASVAAPGSGTSVLTLTASATATTGTSAVTVTGTGGSITHSTTVSLTVSSGGNQLLGNPGFENGSTNPAPWVVTASVINDNNAGRTSHSGSWYAWLDVNGFTHTDTLYQQVAIPSGVSSATLTFWLHIDTAETGTTAVDTLKVQIRDSANTVLSTLATYSNLNPTGIGYVQKSFNLTAFAGQTIRVYFKGAEDASLQSSFVVDDFALTTAP